MSAAKVEPYALLETAKSLQIQSPTLPLGVSALDAALPDEGFPRGQVIELAVAPGAGFGTTLALWACRAAQREAQLQGTSAWCAFMDPSGTLYAPALLEAGIDLERLLVVRPDAEALSRVAVRLAEANAFSVLVIDTVGCLSKAGVQASGKRSACGAKSVGHQHWVRTVRRLALAIQNTHSQVFMITNKWERRPLPLPVGQRIELKRQGLDALELTVSKDKRGRISEARVVHLPENRWGSGAKPLTQSGNELGNQRHVGRVPLKDVSVSSVLPSGSLCSMSLSSVSLPSGTPLGVANDPLETPNIAEEKAVAENWSPPNETLPLSALTTQTAMGQLALFKTNRASL